QPQEAGFVVEHGMAHLHGGVGGGRGGAHHEIGVGRIRVGADVFGVGPGDAGHGVAVQVPAAAHAGEVPPLGDGGIVVPEAALVFGRVHAAGVVLVHQQAVVGGRNRYGQALGGGHAGNE